MIMRMFGMLITKFGRLCDDVWRYDIIYLYLTTTYIETHPQVKRHISLLSSLNSLRMNRHAASPNRFLDLGGSLIHLESIAMYSNHV